MQRLYFYIINMKYTLQVKEPGGTTWADFNELCQPWCDQCTAWVTDCDPAFGQTYSPLAAQCASGSDAFLRAWPRTLAATNAARARVRLAHRLQRRQAEDILMCGWRRDVDDVIREMEWVSLTTLLQEPCRGRLDEAQAQLKMAKERCEHELSRCPPGAAWRRSAPAGRASASPPA